MSLKLFAKILTTYLLLNFLAACDSKSIDIHSPEYADLLSAIESSLELERSRNWEELYKYRTPSYRDTVPHASFVNTMEKQARNIQLTEYKIVSAVKKIEKQKEIVVVSMKFKYSYFDANVDAVTFPDTLEWRKYNDTWFCYDGGRRFFFSLFSPIVIE